MNDGIIDYSAAFREIQARAWQLISLVEGHLPQTVTPRVHAEVKRFRIFMELFNDPRR